MGGGFFSPGACLGAGPAATASTIENAIAVVPDTMAAASRALVAVEKASTRRDFFAMSESVEGDTAGPT